MKNSKKTKLAIVLGALALVTTGVAGYTLAKYITSGDASDSATVAKWGVTVTASSDGIFKSEYTNSSSTVTVKGSGTTKVVAPGTEGSLAAFTISGTPEVRTKVSYSAELTLTNWKINTSDEYCPIVFTVGTTNYKMDSSTTNTTDALETAVENAVADINQTIDAGTNLSTGLSGLTLKWAWAFEGDSSNTFQTNEKDTALGDLSTLPTISFKVTATVEQVQ